MGAALFKECRTLQDPRRAIYLVGFETLDSLLLLLLSEDDEGPAVFVEC